MSHGFLILAMLGLLLPVTTDDPPTFTEAERRAIARLSPLPEPPADPTNRVADDLAAARYGHRLFFEKRFSVNGEVACATCHDPERSFTDGKPVADTLGRGPRQTPHLWNLAYGRWFFWDGRSDSLWSQALGPIENPIEMGGSRLRVARLVLEDPVLRVEHASIFGQLPDSELPASADARPVPDDPDHPHARAWVALTEETRASIDRVFVEAAKALAAYERRLISRDSRFDRFARRLAEEKPLGEDLLDAAAQRGLKIFLGKGGCTLCHHGPNLSDGEFHGLRLPVPGGGFPKDSGRWEGSASLLADPFRADGMFSDAPESGRGSRTRRLRRTPESWGEFKTPTLRQVAETAPYMHAGQFATLKEVLTFYSTFEGASNAGHHQETTLTPRQFTEGEIHDLIAFLETLSGAPLPDALRRPPER